MELNWFPDGSLRNAILVREQDIAEYAVDWFCTEYNIMFWSGLMNKASDGRLYMSCFAGYNYGKIQILFVKENCVGLPF